MLYVASHCRRKWVVVSMFALRSGHMSCFLCPAVYNDFMAL